MVFLVIAIDLFVLFFVFTFVSATAELGKDVSKNRE